MRFRRLRFAFMCVPLSTLACGDEPPVYPPIVIIGGGAISNGGTENASGNQPSSGGASQQGGSKGTSGSSNTAGSDQGGLYAHCSAFSAGEEPPVETECDLDALTDGGELTGDIDADLTLATGNFYTLKGGVRVLPGATLTIEPCVKVVGQDPDAVLVVLSSALGDPKRSCTYDSGTITPAGRLVAVGEPMAPIIFTSAEPPGDRHPGDWGGVLILGNAHNDLALAGVRVPIEGLAQTECHGYHTNEFNDESSGQLEYVRVEYASRQVSADNETNGLTFGSVGSGTKVSHVMVSNSGDDCFEWFGGTVSADHLIAVNCDDDMFDADNGHSGQLQFLFGRQFPTTTELNSFGLEIDNGAGMKTVQTNVRLSNYTLCGGGPDDHNNSRAGMAFRTAAVPSLLNGLVSGFAGPGISVNGATPDISHTRVFGEANLGGEPLFLGLPGNSAEDPDRFCDCWANPATPVAATPIEGGTPSGFADEEATYLGAFKDSSPESNWMKGLWVDWSTE